MLLVGARRPTSTTEVCPDCGHAAHLRRVSHRAKRCRAQIDPRFDFYDSDCGCLAEGTWQ
jgi:hypothetical protein